MITLLDELNNLDPQKQYSISINKVGSFIFVNKKDLKLENIDEKYQHLLKFNLVKKKEISDKTNVLIVKGNTALSVIELVQFQLDLIDYEKSNFEPICVTVAIEKSRKAPATLIAKERKQLKNGGLKPVKFEANSAGKNTAVIGDYFFSTYESYRETLQEIADIWINS
ncbi:hypothetical protein [Lactococcus lactis]|uniref:hypothetical protein n=1 Tax=Lactococcus lactis TaxID=1358 RepID=UPI002025E22A|nr:hypothetical protein [Lactococcus lactis]MCL9640836.1 hypothetical protein [Lactococcus lactis]